MLFRHFNKQLKLHVFNIIANTKSLGCNELINNYSSITWAWLKHTN